MSNAESPATAAPAADAAPVVLTRVRSAPGRRRAARAWRRAVAAGVLVGGGVAAWWFAPWKAADAVAAVPAASSRAAAGTRSPREQCDRRMLVALQRCLQRVCERPAMSAHRDCRRFRPAEAGSRPH